MCEGAGNAPGSAPDSGSASAHAAGGAAANAPDDSSDALARAMRAGDEGALARAFEACRAQLRRMVSYRLDARLEGRLAPSDVLQDAYLAARQRLVHYADVEVPPGIWLRWIVGQRLVELHRRHLARRRDAGRELSLDRGGNWPVSTSASLIAQLAADDPSPSSIARRGERGHKLARALEALSLIDREVLVLRHFESLSNDEVAALLGLDKSAASKRYVRALARLREAMADDPPSDIGVGGDPGATQV